MGGRGSGGSKNGGGGGAASKIEKGTPILKNLNDIKEAEFLRDTTIKK